jgi:hypothetical protein
VKCVGNGLIHGIWDRIVWCRMGNRVSVVFVREGLEISVSVVRRY